VNHPEHMILVVLKKQNPKDPWVNIRQIMEKTGLDRNTVVRNLPSLLESGLVVEHPREKEGQQNYRRQRRYFADPLILVEGIEPLDWYTQQVLSVVTGQNPQNPLVSIKQIMKKTGLHLNTVNRKLTSLLKSGLVVEYPRHGKHRFFADAKKQVEVGVMPLNEILDMLKEQDPKAPWVDIPKIVKKTGQDRRTVVRKLISLITAGLVVEYSRHGKRRYFADALKQIEGILPPNRTTRKILGMVTGQNPRNPWVDIDQIMEKTGLARNTVVINLSSLITAGLLVEFPRASRNQRRYFADALTEEGIEPPNRNIQKVLAVVTGQNSRNPWVSIKQIVEMTGLTRNTVVIILTSLQEAGLVVEHLREIEGQQQRRQRRYFADAFKKIEGIEPQEQGDLEPEEQEDFEYVPHVSLSHQEVVLVDFLMALKRGYQWLKRDQIGVFDHPFSQHLQDIKFNELSELLELLIQEKLVRSKVEGQHRSYALTPAGIQIAQPVSKYGRVQG
jgi:DNA-binding IclR family transcriptional regulator